MNKRLLISTIAGYLFAILCWTILFYRNRYLKEVLTDIHLIFTATIVVFLVIRFLCSASLIDFIKVFFRTLFRVWLFIFISLAITRSMDRIGFLLSITFIFGYIEGLLDLSRWLETNPRFLAILPPHASMYKSTHALATVLMMSLVHILCALAVFVFYLFF
ncbi:MAG: hypothetical protein MUF62_07990 [Chitinophagaceae bacterium]|nr:hypothetical protein [Chitinophagaceae bacterium]